MSDDWIVDGNEETVRDTLLTMGNYLFKKKDIDKAADFFGCAHNMHKTVLSGFMKLACIIENGNAEDMIKAWADAAFVAEMSFTNDEKLDEFRFKIRKFLLDQNDVECTTAERKSAIIDFEKSLWPLR